MQKILVFTDIHFLPEGETIIGLDPVERFAQGLAHAVKNQPEAARIIIAGDLAHKAETVAYARLRDVLADCPIPVSLMVGNHDRRAPFLEVFPNTPLMDEGFVQDVIDLPGYRLILLDTLNEDGPDTHSGWLCEARLDFLTQALKTTGDRRAIVFTHHPPFLTGFKGMDWIGLKNRAELTTRLSEFSNVAHVISGHVHRTIHGAAGGIPASVFKSPCHQQPLAIGFKDPRISVDEPGAYGVLLLDEKDGVVVLTEDFTLPDPTIGLDT